MITTSSRWTDAVGLGNVEVLFLVRLYYGNESSYIALSSYDTTHDSVFYRGLLRSFPTSNEGLDIFTHKHTISNITLDFINSYYIQDVKFSDYVEDTSLGSGADIGFYNRKCEIKLATPSVTTWADSFPFYVGVVREIQHDIKSVKLTIEDRNSYLKYINIPKERIDTTTYPLAPNDSQGKTINDVIGDHSFTNIDGTSPSISLSHDSIMVKGIDIRAYRNHFVFANNTSQTITTDDIWLFDTQTKRFLKVDSSHVAVSNPDSDGYTSVALNFTSGNMIVYDWWLPDGGSNPPASYDFSSPGNAGDSDLTTFATLSQEFNSSVSTKTAILRVAFPEYDMSGYEYIDEMEIFYLGAYSNMSGNDADVTIGVAGSGIDVTSLLNVKSITSAGTINDIGSSDLAKSTHTLEYSNGDGSDTFTLGYDGIYTGNIAESASFSTLASAIEALDDFDDIEGSKINNQFYIQYKGKSMGRSVPIPDIIDKTDDLNVSVAETQNGKTVTEEMVGSEGSGYLEVRVRQPSGSAHTPVVYLRVYELYKKLKLVFSSVRNLDRSRFEVYARMSGREYGSWINGRSTAESFSVNHPDDDGSGDLIENPSGVLESIYRDDLGFVDADIVEDDFNVTADHLSSWKHSFTTTKETNSKDLITSVCRESKSFSYIRADDTIRHKTIKDTYSSSDATIKKNEILDIRFTRTPIKDIKTKVLVLYANDYSGNNKKETSASQSTDAQSKYNIVAADSLLEYKSSHIADTTTAESLRDYLLSQWKQPHNIVEMSLPIKYVYLETGDVIEFLGDGIRDANIFNVFGEDILKNNTRMSQTIYKYWFITETKKTGNKITLKAFQLHDLR